MKYSLRTDEENVVNNFGFYILKVPEYVRQAGSPNNYTPVDWRFGLHNRENLEITGSEALKLSVAVACRLVGERWDNFCDVVVDDPRSMLRCYGLPQEASMREEEIKYMLALDALFLAVGVQSWNVMEPIRRLFQVGWSTGYGVLLCDIFKVENQIPFLLIERAIGYLKEQGLRLEDRVNLNAEGNDTQLHRRYLEEWMSEAVYFTVSNFMNVRVFMKDKSYTLQCKHILGAAYKVICGPKGVWSRSDFSQHYVHVPSATKLLASGITIRAVSGPLCSMAYANKCLSLPKIRFSDATV